MVGQEIASVSCPLMPQGVGYLCQLRMCNKITQLSALLSFYHTDGLIWESIYEIMYNDNILVQVVQYICLGPYYCINIETW